MRETPFWRRYLRLPGRDPDADVEDELAFHLSMRVDDLVRQGHSDAEARAQAEREFGDVTRVRGELLDIGRRRLRREGHARWWDALGQDLRLAARSLRKNAGLTGVIVLTLALGIGANTAMFSVIDAVLLEPLPYPGADRIVTLSTAFLRSGGSQRLVSIANFRDWRDQAASFEAMAVYRGGESAVTQGTAAEYANTASVGPGFFRVFAVEPALGRVPAPDEITANNRPVLISHAFWQSRFGGDPGVLERTLRVNGDRRPIAGVLPAGFGFPDGTDIWAPGRAGSTSRTGHNYFAVGRLRPDVSLERAQAELTAIATALEERYPESNEGRGVVATRLQDHMTGDVRLTLYLLWGVVGVVLLITCANTATLLLGRAATRAREVAVRAALGASRRRIVRLLITESLLLALVAGACGVLLAYWGVEAFVALAPADVVRRAEVGIGGTVLAFTLIVSLATSLAFGVVPALSASRVDLAGAVKDGDRHAGGGRRTLRTRGALVVSEIALAVVLLTGAGLLIKSLVALNRVELGYRPQNVLVMKAGAPRSFFRQVLARTAALPGVVAAGATSTPPGDLSLAGSGSYFIDRVPDVRDRPTEPKALFTIATPGTFAALGIPLRAGRAFNASDTEDGRLVAVVNEALVRESLAGEDALGHAIFCSFDRDEPMTIVGVVGDVRQRDPALAPMPQCYMPYTQHAYNSGTLHVVLRTAGDPLALTGVVRRLAAEISPDVAVAFTTMEAIVASRMGDRTFRVLLFALFGALAVGLAMVGVYGVMAYAVEQRTREIGLRMALGASQGSVLRLILGRGLLLAAAGLALGLAAALAAMRLLSSLLFQVAPVDAQVYLGVVALLGAVTLAAGYLPGRRASGVDPVEVLGAD